MNLELINKIEAHFINNYKTQPILVFSPGRINLIGEHTDYNNGFVFPAAIDKGIVAALQKSDSKKSSIIALDINEQLDFSLNDIASVKNGGWKNYVLGVVSEIQKKEKILGNFNLVFGGDIPQGAGLSSSAALENSIAFGLNELFKLGLSKKEMIFISQKAEHNYVGVKCGIMDQYVSMFGKKDSAILLDCQSLIAQYVPFKLEDYEILLINTNVKHSLVESAYNNRKSICKNVALKLNIPTLRHADETSLLSIKNQITEADYQKTLYIIQENQRVHKAFDAIKKNTIDLFGELLYASHKGLQHQYKVSCDELNFLVDITKSNANVIGSRMMGGGFGGCTINIVRKNTVSLFEKEIAIAYNENFDKNCLFYLVKFSDGTRVIKKRK
jgi:galactokinase